MTEGDAYKIHIHDTFNGRAPAQGLVAGRGGGRWRGVRAGLRRRTGRGKLRIS